MSVSTAALAPPPAPNAAMPVLPTSVRYVVISGLPASTCSIFVAASLVAASRVPAGSTWSIRSVLSSADSPMKSVFNKVAEASVPAKISTAASRVTIGCRRPKRSTGR